MTTIDRDRLRRYLSHAAMLLPPDERVVTVAEGAAMLDALSAAEHRATRAEAQSAIRGRAVQICQKQAREAEARIKAVRDLHRRFGIYEHEDACTDTTDEHREEHHHEDSDSIGEYYCDQMPLYAVCDHCRDEDGERDDWPCPTIRALDGVE